MIKKTSLILLSLLLFFSSISIAVELNVPADYATIQSAINAATDGDTIVVSPGQYEETGLLIDKQITVTSLNGPHNTYLLNSVSLANTFRFLSNANGA